MIKLLRMRFAFGFLIAMLALSAWAHRLGTGGGA